MIDRYKPYFEKDFDQRAYLTWKKENVTYRGIKSVGKDNEVYGSWGQGLYTVPLSNKVMAKQYGKIYFVINAIPKKPVIVQSINSAEIFRQKIIIDFCKKKGAEREYDPSFFEKYTSMDKELINQGYDGFMIKGREMVNYTPKNIEYFETEEQVKNYYESL